MSAKLGRPTDNKKTQRLEIRLTQDEVDAIEECANVLKVSKTEVVHQGIQLVREKLNKK